MARISTKALTAAIRAPFVKRFGLLTNADAIDSVFDNNYVQKGASTADTATTDVEIYRVDADNQLRIGGTVSVPTPKVITFTVATNALLVSQAFWIADQPFIIKGAKLIFATANGATMTGYIGKVTGTNTVSSAATVQVGTFNLNATANVVQDAVLSAVPTDLSVVAGDRLAFIFTGTLTALAGLTVSITMLPGNKNYQASYIMQANGGLADSSFYTPNRPVIVTRIDCVYTTLGTDAAAVNVQVVKDTATDAPGAGTDLLTNNSNAGFNLKSPINTVQNGTLTATAASLRLAPGDRLSVDFAGTLTAVAGVIVTVTVQPTLDYVGARYSLNANANLVDQTFFVADRPYRIVAIREVHAVAGVDAGAVSLQVVIDKTTDAPGVGTDTLTNNTNVGFNMKGTANTVQIGTLVDFGSLYLMAGDRLSVDYAGVLTSLSGVQVTVGLVPA